MKIKSQDNTDTWLAILLGVLTIFLVKSIFENDDSKIVSKKGRKFLSDEDKMSEINGKINSSEASNHHEEVVV